MNSNFNELFPVQKNIEKPIPADLNDYKVQHETHRMMGLLRFTPNEDGEFIARCAPDHFILPFLEDYFNSRFNETAWSIIDEKRGLCLRRRTGERAKIIPLNEEASAGNEAAGTNNKPDDWEELWKHYHKTINNADRNNPNLQRQFMPKRYWKYLPEIEPGLKTSEKG